MPSYRPNDLKRAAQHAHQVTRVLNLRIPSKAEMAHYRLCYPPSPPVTLQVIDDTIFDLEGDVCMRNKQ